MKYKILTESVHNGHGKLIETKFTIQQSRIFGLFKRVSKFAEYKYKLGSVGPHENSIHFYPTRFDSIEKAERCLEYLENPYWKDYKGETIFKILNRITVVEAYSVYRNGDYTMCKSIKEAQDLIDTWVRTSKFV